MSILRLATSRAHASHDAMCCSASRESVGVERAVGGALALLFGEMVVVRHRSSSLVRARRARHS